MPQSGYKLMSVAHNTHSPSGVEIVPDSSKIDWAIFVQAEVEQPDFRENTRLDLVALPQIAGSGCIPESRVAIPNAIYPSNIASCFIYICLMSVQFSRPHELAAIDQSKISGELLQFQSDPELGARYSAETRILYGACKHIQKKLHSMAVLWVYFEPHEFLLSTFKDMNR